MTFEEIKSERIINITHLSLICKESLENSFVVYFRTTDKPILCNGYGWSDNVRIAFIAKLAAEIQDEPFKIIQNENIFFVVRPEKVNYYYEIRLYEDGILHFFSDEKTEAEVLSIAEDLSKEWDGDIQVYYITEKIDEYGRCYIDSEELIKEIKKC